MFTVEENDRRQQTGFECFTNNFGFGNKLFAGNKYISTTRNDTFFL